MSDTEKKPKKKITPTAASEKPDRRKRAPKRFQFKDETENASPKKRKRTTSKSKSKKPTKKRKVTKKKEGQPKRPLSGYLFFCQKHRAEIKDKYPNLKLTDVSKKLGKLWGKAGKKEKEEMQKLADNDKVRYEKQMKKWNAKQQSSSESEEESSSDSSSSD
eukprot:TRINITY_DN2174_c0_g1_i1.p3 TRINITY_DN2174_c0_g1~~TRINITY_DN2174_c0_g1_i1.p3  ORF type:complete len:161 (+),score=42.63 TRINITY_DN2174_c0_g1_i1:276-758(+)